MGFKASCILFSEREPLHLDTMPTHDPVRARGWSPTWAWGGTRVGG